MIKMRDLLAEILNEDTGEAGKDFEKKFIEALKLTGLEFDVNRGSGALWDIRPKGDGWSRILTNQDVNIKVARTKWMFGSSELGKLLPWDDIETNFDLEKSKKIIRVLLRKKGVQDNIFLKPKDDSIQDQIISSVNDKDINSLNKLLIRNNFYAEKLGTDYDIRILTKDNYITSIVIDKGGTPFIRAERPRQVGGSSGFVAFKAASPKLGVVTRKVKAV